MASGLSSTTLAKQTKDKLDRMGVFRNDQGDDSSHPRPYSDAKTWGRAMGEKLNYSATDLRKNLEGCLITARYDIPFRVNHIKCLILSVLQRARKIASAYVDGKPFSVELVAAVCHLPLGLITQAAKFDNPRQ